MQGAINIVDYKKLYAIFVEESLERLSELEDSLLQMEKSPDKKELIDTIFRAAHTIKGSSGTIGLTEISRFTHDMEEILDSVRNNQLDLEDKLINILLESVDLIKEMIEAVSSETPFDFSKCEYLTKRMDEIKVSGSRMSDAQYVLEPENCNPKAEANIRTFKIIFSPSEDLFKRGIDPLIILEDLKGMGEVMHISVNTEAVPALSEFEPENLYLRWVVLLRSIYNQEEIRKIFEFVEEGSEISILPVKESDYENYSVPIGKMLVEEGIVTSEDIEEAARAQKKIGEILIEQGKAEPREIEKVLEKQINKKAESFKNTVSSSIRVDLKKLDHLINIVGEMVIIHSMFQQALQGNGGNSTPERLDMLFSQLQRIGSDIQESAMSLRMLPVGEVFQRFRRLVRELSASKNKNIDLIITGEDTELDKGVIEKITDPLVHLIRNAIDHGIESPDDRLAKGKTPKGTLSLSAYQSGDSVYIEIEDDGKGVNKEKVIERALQRGIINTASGLTDEQICNLIFLPGFSTADKVTDVSGRGVGMDVVKRNIESLNGKVYILTKKNAGTTISIKLPLTLAIIDGLTLLVGEEIFVIPISAVIESLLPRKEDVKTLNEKGEVINIRGEFVPLIRLYKGLGIAPWKENPWEAIIVVIAHENKKYCLMADELIGQQQIVIKKLGKAMPRVKAIAGGTILGDGRVALVLDVPGLVDMAKCGDR